MNLILGNINVLRQLIVWLTNHGHHSGGDHVDCSMLVFGRVTVHTQLSDNRCTDLYVSKAVHRLD